VEKHCKNGSKKNIRWKLYFVLFFVYFSTPLGSIVLLKQPGIEVGG